MAVKFVGFTVNGSSDLGKVTDDWTLPADWRADDTAIFWMGHTQSNVATATGVSIKRNAHNGLSGIYSFIGYRRLVTGDTTFTWTTNTGGTHVGWGVAVFRDSPLVNYGDLLVGDPFENEWGAPLADLNDGTPDAPPVTVLTPGAAVVTMVHGPTDGSFTAPAGYTIAGEAVGGGLAYKLDCPVGVEDPGDWGSLGILSDTNVWTGSIRPYVVAGLPWSSVMQARRV